MPQVMEPEVKETEVRAPEVRETETIEKREVWRPPAEPAPARLSGPVYQAYAMLRFVFIVAPIVAGLDKFSNFLVGRHLLVDWQNYLAPVIPGSLGIDPHTFMYGVGAVEIIGGLLVAFAPVVGGTIVGLWLLGIVGNLLLLPGYFDIALRDFGLALSAFALARLASHFRSRV